MSSPLSSAIETADRARDLSLRGFLAELEAADPTAVLRIRERVTTDFDITAIAMELERRGEAPVLWFEDVAGFDFPVVTNVFANRRRFAMALGVPEEDLVTRWAARDSQMIDAVQVETGPCRDVVLSGSDINLAKLPLLVHFEQDAGRYITNAVVIAKDPDSGVHNASFHRMQVKGHNRLGTSLHSRRHLWNYVRRNDERGQPTPISIVIGTHPLITFGALWKGSIDADEYAVIGGLINQPLAVVPGLTVPVDVPSQSEFVIEGRILPNVREPEGPFAEFTGYASERSTQNVVEVTAISYRRDAIYQDIIPGISDEHTMLLAVPGEARLLRNLRQQYPNVTGVAYPKSGACRFHAYISMRQPAPGQARNAAAVAFGDDLSLKLVIVVDDDVDIRDDRDVLWALATRMQADEDIDVMRNAMGAILDPSNKEWPYREDGGGRDVPSRTLPRPAHYSGRRCAPRGGDIGKNRISLSQENKGVSIASLPPRFQASAPKASVAQEGRARSSDPRPAINALLQFIPFAILDFVDDHDDLDFGLAVVVEGRGPENADVGNLAYGLGQLLLVLGPVLLDDLEQDVRRIIRILGVGTGRFGEIGRFVIGHEFPELFVLLHLRHGYDGAIRRIAGELQELGIIDAGDAGSHRILIGRVVEARCGEALPLVYARHGYRGIADIDMQG